jgi:hypothetical protein
MENCYDDSLIQLLDEIDSSTTLRVSGSKFVRDYIQKNALYNESKDEDEEPWINNQIDLYENWLKLNHDDKITIGRNYYWSRKLEQVQPKDTTKIKEPKKINYHQANKLLAINLQELTEAQGKELHKTSLQAVNNHDFEEAFTFSKRYYDCLSNTNASDSDKLKALSVIIKGCTNKNGITRADTYEYYCKKAEIYTKQYEHSEAAREYQLAINLLEKENKPKIDCFSLAKSDELPNSRIPNVKENLTNIYQKCRIQYQNAGMDNEASEVYVKESHHTRKHLKLGGKRIFMWLLWLLARYGESPWRVAGWAIVVIFGFTFIYMLTGVNTPSGLSTFSCVGEMYKLHCDELEPISQNQPSYWTLLYYSVVTFTTLGYGDFSPIPGVSRFVSASEALFGLILTSLFLGTFIKKYSR